LRTAYSQITFPPSHRPHHTTALGRKAARLTLYSGGVTKEASEAGAAIHHLGSARHRWPAVTPPPPSGRSVPQCREGCSHPCRLRKGGVVRGRGRDRERESDGSENLSQVKGKVDYMKHHKKGYKISVGGG